MRDVFRLILDIRRRRRSWRKRFLELDRSHAALVSGSIEAIALSRDLLLRTNPRYPGPDGVFHAKKMSRSFERRLRRGEVLE